MPKYKKVYQVCPDCRYKKLIKVPCSSPINIKPKEVQDLYIPPPPILKRSDEYTIYPMSPSSDDYSYGPNGTNLP